MSKKEGERERGADKEKREGKERGKNEEICDSNKNTPTLIVYGLISNSLFFSCNYPIST
jgi:hypothetical protein